MTKAIPHRVDESVHEACSKCGKSMERRIRKVLRYKDLTKGAIYSAWDVCTCGMVQHYEKYKITIDQNIKHN